MISTPERQKAIDTVKQAIKEAAIKLRCYDLSPQDMLRALAAIESCFVLCEDQKEDVVGE